MAENKQDEKPKTVEEKPAAKVSASTEDPTLDKKSADLVKKIDSKIDYFRKFEGKAGFNPFFKIKELSNLRRVVVNGDTHDDIAKQIDNIKEVEPKV